MYSLEKLHPVSNKFLNTISWCYVLVTMAGWTAGVTAIFVRVRVPVNGTCLGYGALVNSTTPIRGRCYRENAGYLSTDSYARNVYCDNQGTIHDIIKLMV